MRAAKFLDIIKSFGGYLRVDNKAGYKETYELDDLGDNDFMPKSLVVTNPVSKFTINKLGSDVDADGNIDTSADSIPATNFLLGVEIDGEPDFSPHFYSHIQDLVYGFDPSISPTAEITITFI